MRAGGLGGGQGLGRQHGQQCRAGSPHQPRSRPGADRRGPARPPAAVGDRLQRRPRPFRAGARPRLPGAGPPRHQDQRHRRRRHGLLGHPGALARRPCVAAARRQVPGRHAGLRLRRLGAGRGHRRGARGLCRARRLSRREDARRRRRRRPAHLGAPGAGGTRPSRLRYRHHGRCPRHLFGEGGAPLRAAGGGMRPRLVRGAGERRRQGRHGHGPGGVRHPRCRRRERVHPLRLPRPAGPSGGGLLPARSRHRRRHHRGHADRGAGRVPRGPSRPTSGAARSTSRPGSRSWRSRRRR